MSVFDKEDGITTDALIRMGFKVSSESFGIVAQARLVIRTVDAIFNSWEYVPALILDYYGSLGVKATRRYIDGEYKTLNIKFTDIMDIESIIASEKNNMINELLASWEDRSESPEDLRKMITFKYNE